MDLGIVSAGAAHLLMKRYAGPFWIRRKWLGKTQWLDEAGLRALQLARLRRLVEHSYRTVPYYQRLMAERGIRPDDIRSLEDIKQFPVLTKAEVIHAGKTMVSTMYPRLLLRTAVTGGTTGTPLVVWRNPSSIGNEHAFVRRQWDWAGLGLRDRTAYLSWREVLKPNRSVGRFYAYDPFMKELVLSSYHLSETTAQNYMEVVKRYSVRAIIGYPSAITFMARWCLTSGVRVPLKAVLTTSEALSQEMREAISAAFSCKVFDYYGAAERVCYIHMCERGMYHIVPEYGYTELIAETDMEAETYRIVSTGFWNLGMPLIRYDTGDVVRLAQETCRCGRSFPVVHSIIGRGSDSIVTTSGRRVGPTLVARITKGLKNVLEVQVCQIAADHITIRYVPDGQFTDTDLESFKSHVNHYLGSEFRITYERTDRVERTAMGKVRLIVSHMKEPRGDA